MLAELNLATIGMAGSAGATFRGLLPVAMLIVIALILVHALVVVARRRGSVARTSWGWWEVLVYLGTLASVVLLAVTSFGAMWRFGVMGGWWLFAHMFGAGVFTVVLPVLALTWCEANRFCRPVPAAGAEAPLPSSGFLCLAKSMFWVILAAGLVVTGTMLLSMLPMFGTHGLELFLDIHRYAGLAVVAATILHLYATILPRLGLS